MIRMIVRQSPQPPRPREYDDLSRQPWYLPSLHSLVDRMNLRPGERGFDGGCGTGNATHLILDKVGPTGFVVGVDLSDDMLAVARPKFEGLKNAAFVKGSFTDLSAAVAPYRPLSFGVSAHVIHYLSEGDRPKAITEAAKAIEPGGRFGFSTLYFEGSKSPEVAARYQRFSRILVRKLAEAYRGDREFVRTAMEPFRLRETKAEDYRRFMEDAGFDVTHFSTDPIAVNAETLKVIYDSRHTAKAFLPKVPEDVAYQLLKESIEEATADISDEQTAPQRMLCIIGRKK